MKILLPTAEGLSTAADAIGAGEIVAYPTETVYGLGVDPFSPVALDLLFTIKGRDSRNPVLLIVDSEAQLHQVVGEISPGAAACMKAFWPGPLSLLFPKADGLPDVLSGPDGRICVRQTSCPIARALCRAVGHAITSTSANRSGEPPVETLCDLALEGVIAGIDGGRLTPSAPSTVFDPDAGRVLRPGAIPEMELFSVLQLK